MGRLNQLWLHQLRQILQWLSLQSQCLLQLLKLQHLQRARSEQVTILPFTTTSLKSERSFRWNTRPACVAVSPDDLTLFFSTEIEISLKNKVVLPKKKKKKKKKSQKKKKKKKKKS